MYVTFSILITARKISLIYLLLYRTFMTSIAFMKRISSYVHSSVFMLLIIDTERFPLWKFGNVAFPFDFSAWIQIWMNIRKWSDLQIDRDNGKEMWINLMNLSLSPTDVTLSNTGRKIYIYLWIFLICSIVVLITGCVPENIFNDHLATHSHKGYLWTQKDEINTFRKW